MIHPIFQPKWYIVVLLVTCCLLAGLLQAALLSPLVAVPWMWLLLDGMVYAILLGAISIPLMIVIRFVDFAKGNKFQQWLNSFALCVLTIGCWLGLGMLVMYICLPNEYFTTLLPTIPLRIIGGVLLYIIVVQRYIMLTKEDKAIEEEKEKEALVEMIEETETEEVSDPLEILDRIAVKVGQKIHVIAIPDILYLQAEGDYVMIHTADGRYLKEQTMKYFEQHLPNNKFVRVHRSCIVNVEIISRVELYEKQNYLLYLQNGQKIKASINGYKLLKRTLSL
jgi:hypothetical protein